MTHKVEKFEDLVAWQKARVLTKEIYTATRKGALRRDYGLSGQMQRASVSMMSNVAEGFERGKRGEFHQFLSIAKGSCAETRSLLYVAFDCEYLEQSEFDRLMSLAQEEARIIGGLRAAVERQRDSNR
ncbi:MAG: four helix bundle protein [Chloroflexi bacterium]|nr:four helix bundle protein [Chloroflexota bacterium]